MIPGDARFDDEGWHYGVRYHDGSVTHRWNGATQRDRAQEFIDKAYAWVRARRPDGNFIDSYELVRHRRGGSWELAGPPTPSQRQLPARLGVGEAEA